MKVTVTGGQGFIGRSVLRQLSDQGHEATAYDRHNIGFEDVRNPAEVALALRGQDAVIHLAGMLGTAELFDFPLETVRTNVVGTLNVLRSCERFGVRYVGITMPDVWKNVYQATKRCAKDLAEAWNAALGVPVSHVRAYNVYGPGQKVGTPQKLVPTFSTKAWAGQPLPIWGSGNQYVDLVHVEDVARMLVRALDFGECQVFDAGTGHMLTVEEFAQLVMRVTGSRAVEYLPMRPGEQEGRAPVALGEGWAEAGFRPRYRPDELEATIESYRKVATVASPSAANAG